jgi:hypothetical protein
VCALGRAEALVTQPHHSDPITALSKIPPICSINQKIVEFNLKPHKMTVEGRLYRPLPRHPINVAPTARPEPLHSQCLLNHQRPIRTGDGRRESIKSSLLSELLNVAGNLPNDPLDLKSAPVDTVLHSNSGASEGLAREHKIAPSNTSSGVSDGPFQRRLFFR